MVKAEVVEKLIQEGYKASLESNVVMVELENDGESLDNYRESLERLGYHASYGFRAPTVHAGQQGKTASRSVRAGTPVGNTKSKGKDGSRPSEKNTLPPMDSFLRVDENGQVSFF